MVKQKEFVVSEVKRILGATFQPFVTKALLALSKDELELLKERTYAEIITGTVEYGKDVFNLSEVRAYARSMVMNHLKKARELNGNLVYSSSGGSTKAAKAEPVAPKGIVTSVLTPELQRYVRDLV